MPATLKPPVQPPASQPAPQAKCIADFQPDGSLLIQFTVSAEMARRFVRNAGNDLVGYIWNTRGLRHFEHQPLT